jgi:hypothetical protein
MTLNEPVARFAKARKRTDGAKRQKAERDRLIAQTRAPEVRFRKERLRQSTLQSRPLPLRLHAFAPPFTVAKFGYATHRTIGNGEAARGFIP